MTLLSIDNLNFSYGTAATLREISLRVAPGEIYCLLGPNGCGKTTLIDCVLGQHPLKSGAISLGSRPIQTLKPAEVASQIAFVPQLHAKTFPYSVFEIVLMGRTFATGTFSSPDRRDREIAREAIAMTGLEEIAQKPYTQISGGELQLVMIARALAQKAKLIIMDEPTSHLDFKNENEILNLICALTRTEGLSFLLTTHDLNHPLYFENSGMPVRVGIMEQGRLIAQGLPSEVLTSDTIERLYHTRVLTHTGVLDGLPYSYIMAVPERRRDAF